MQLIDEQRANYWENGFLILRDIFPTAEIDQLCDCLEEDCQRQGPHYVPEPTDSEGGTVYAPHHRDDRFSRLVRAPALLEPAQNLLDTAVYVYQMKVIHKSPLGDNKVEWHQDYMAWKIADRLPRPDLVNAAILLDESTEFNGPLMFIPGSHKRGVLGTCNETDDARSHLDPEEISLTADDLADVEAEQGIVSIHGAPGTVVLFHPLLVHSSPPNMSPRPRRLLITTYNATDNQPQRVDPRPDYLVGRDTAPLSSDDCAQDSRAAETGAAV